MKISKEFCRNGNEFDLFSFVSDPSVQVEGRDCGRPYHCAVIGGFRGVTVLALRRTPAASLRASDPSLMHHDATRPSGLGTWWSGRTSWSGHIRVIAHKYHSPPRTSSARSHLEITTQFAGLQCALSNSSTGVPAVVIRAHSGVSWACALSVSVVRGGGHGVPPAMKAGVV